MNQNHSPLGSCPECAAAIIAPAVLIEYETAAGTAVYVECPDCGRVVHPERPAPPA